MPTIVLLPGMEGTGELFTPLVAALPADWKKVVVAYPRKRLPVAQIEDIVQSALSLEDDYILLGESFSSPLAIRIASQAPKGLRGLVLAGGFASSPVTGWKRTVMSMFAPLLFRRPVTSGAVRKNLLSPEASDAQVEWVRAVIASVPAEVMSQRLRQVLATDVRTELAAVRVPTLYLQARRDAVVGDECAKEVVRIRPDVELVALDTIHLILQTMPEESAGILQRFVEGYLRPAIDHGHPVSWKR